MRILITIMLLISAATVSAAELDFQLHGLSYHADRTAGYNETNRGLGLRYYGDNSGSFITGGAYYNSIRNTSLYLGIGQEYQVEKYLKLVWTAGVITGYQGKVLPFFVPSITLFNRVHLVAIPYPEPVVEISVDVLKFNWSK